MSAFHEPQYAHFDTRCPIVRTEKLEITKIVDLSEGARILAPAHALATIHWIRQSEATYRMVAESGSVIREFSTYNDFYGLMSSVADPIRRAIDLTSQYGIAASSALRLEAIVTVTDTPAWTDPSSEPLRGNFKRYIPVPGGVYRRDDEAINAWLEAVFPERGELYKNLQPIRPVRVLDQEVLYSSADASIDYQDVVRHALDGLEEAIAIDIRTKIFESVSGAAAA